MVGMWWGGVGGGASPVPLPVPSSWISSPSVSPTPSGTECCPVNWVDHDGSCYWFSRSGKPWLEAEKYCQLENAHLVVINSREEQVKPQPSQRQEETLGMQTLGGWVRLVLLFFSNPRKNPEAEICPCSGRSMMEQPLILRGGRLHPGVGAKDRSQETR